MKRTVLFRVNQKSQAEFRKDIDTILTELFPKCEWTKDEDEFFSIGMCEATLVGNHLCDFENECQERGIEIIALTFDFEPFIKRCDFFFIDVGDEVRPFLTFGGQAKRRPIIKKILGEYPNYYYSLFGEEGEKRRALKDETLQKMITYYIESRYPSPKGA